MTIVAQLKAPERPEYHLYLIVWGDARSRGGAEVRIADDGAIIAPDKGLMRTAVIEHLKELARV